MAQTFRVITIFILLLFMGCAEVPVQLRDAMDIQKTEIERVKRLYMENVKNLLNSIEKYRIAILNIYEDQLRTEHSKAFDIESKPDGTTELKEVDPVGDPDVDFLHISTLRKIEKFFDKKREEVRRDISDRRKKYKSLLQNYENIEKINVAVREYIDSLTRLKNAQDKFAKNLVKKVKELSPIPIPDDLLPDPTEFREVLREFSP